MSSSLTLLNSKSNSLGSSQVSQKQLAFSEALAVQKALLQSNQSHYQQRAKILQQNEDRLIKKCQQQQKQLIKQMRLIDSLQADNISLKQNAQSLLLRNKQQEEDQASQMQKNAQMAEQAALINDLQEQLLELQYKYKQEQLRNELTTIDLQQSQTALEQSENLRQQAYQQTDMLQKSIKRCQNSPTDRNFDQQLRESKADLYVYKEALKRRIQENEKLQQQMKEQTEKELQQSNYYIEIQDTQLQEQSELLQQSQSRIEELTSQNEELISKNAILLEISKDKYSSAEQIARNQLAEMEQRNQQLLVQIQKHEKERDLKEQQLNNCLEQLQQDQKAMSDIMHQNEQVTAQHEKAEQMQAQLAEMQQESNEREQKAAQLKSRNCQLEERISELEAQNASAQQLIQRELQQREQIISSLKQQLQGAHQQITMLQGSEADADALNLLAAAPSRQQPSVFADGSDIEESASQVTKLCQENDKLRQEIEEWAAKYDELLQSQGSGAQSDSALALQQQYRDLSARHDQLQSDFQALKDEKFDLIHQLNLQQVQIDEWHGRSREGSSGASDGEQSAAQPRQQEIVIAELRCEIEHLKEQNAQLHDEKAQVVVQYEQLKLKYDSGRKNELLKGRLAELAFLCKHQQDEFQALKQQNSGYERELREKQELIERYDLYFEDMEREFKQYSGGKRQAIDPLSGKQLSRTQ